MKDKLLFSIKIFSRVWNPKIQKFRYSEILKALFIEQKMYLKILSTNYK